MESRFELQLECSKTSSRHSHMSETWDVKIFFTLCVNTSISLSTEYLQRLYVICSWDKSSWCDLQIRKKILKQQLLFSNTLCLFIASRRSGTFKCFHSNFCKVTTIEVARNSLVTDQVLFSVQMKKCLDKIKENPTFLVAKAALSFLYCSTVCWSWSSCSVRVTGSWWRSSVSPFKEIATLSSRLGTTVKWPALVGSLFGNCAAEKFIEVSFGCLASIGIWIQQANVWTYVSRCCDNKIQAFLETVLPNLSS